MGTTRTAAQTSSLDLGRPVEDVLSALGERLEAALGTDPWALGHRSAAFAFAARLVDEESLNAFLSRRSDPDAREVAVLLRRYLADPRDVRGFPTD